MSTLPARDDQFATWLKTQRDEYHPTKALEREVIDDLLELYRLHADTGVPLDEHACEGRCDVCLPGEYDPLQQ